jgi:hypothetical protein
MPKTISKTNSKEKKTVKGLNTGNIVQAEDMMEFEKKIQKLSNEELKDILLINTYKLAMTRAKLEAVIEILIREKVMTYEEIWKRTNDIFKGN